MLITYTGLWFLVLVDLLVLITITLNWRALRYRYLRYAALAMGGELLRQLCNILYIANDDFLPLLIASALLQVAVAACVLIAVAWVTETTLRSWWIALPIVACPIIATVVFNSDLSTVTTWFIATLPAASLHFGACFMLMTRGRADTQGKGWMLILLLFILVSQITMALSVGEYDDWFTLSYFINSVIYMFLGLNFAYLAVETAHDETLRAEADRRRLESRMFQAQKLESLGVLAGGIAHDFNNLLVGVLGNAALAKLDLEDDHPARESVEQIEQSANRARDLVSQLLAYSGRGKFHLEYVNLSTLVREMTQLLESAISKKAHIRYELAPDLPLVHADATQVRQIIMNFITNASDALEGAPGDITVTTGRLESTDPLLQGAVVHSSLREGPCAFLQVRDSGTGLDAEIIQSIFDPFFSTKQSGHGLGLAAVIGIVRSHSGALTVETRRGDGTAFTVAFPVVEADVVAPSAVATAAPEETVAPVAEAPAAVVLVCAENPGQLSRLARVVHQAGLEALPAVDCTEVLERMRDAAQPLDSIVYVPSGYAGEIERVVGAARNSREDVPLILLLENSAQLSETDENGIQLHLLDVACSDSDLEQLMLHTLRPVINGRSRETGAPSPTEA